MYFRRESGKALYFKKRIGLKGLKGHSYLSLANYRIGEIPMGETAVLDQGGSLFTSSCG
jgi:hypothetical protein